MKISKEVKIGLIVVSGIALLFWGINYLKGKDLFTTQKLAYAVYTHVEGLAASNPVTVNGMKIGLVKNLTLIPDNSGRILVSLHISNSILIPRNSIAEIYSTDILGSKGIRLLLGNSTEELQDKDTLQSSVQKSLPDEVNAQVAPIKQKTENLISSLDSVLHIIRTVFNESTKQNLRNSFESISHSLLSIENVAESMDTVLAKEGRLRMIFDNLESITTNFRNNNEKLTTMINNFAAISDTIARSNISGTLETTRKTLEQTASIMEKVNKGEGSMGLLMNNDSLYNNLSNSARDLDLLLNDFRKNPKKYVKFSVIAF